jgi:hypothetical protein
LRRDALALSESGPGKSASRCLLGSIDPSPLRPGAESRGRNKHHRGRWRSRAGLNPKVVCLLRLECGW